MADSPGIVEGGWKGQGSRPHDQVEDVDEPRGRGVLLVHRHLDGGLAGSRGDLPRLKRVFGP